MFAASKTSAVATGSPPPSTDPQFNYVTMLLHGDGTNGAQNNTFVDSSTNNFTITRNGTPTQGSFSPYGDLWSNNFNGSTDRLGISHNTALDLSTGSWTIEGWMYVTSGTYYRTMVAKRVASGATCEWEFGVSNSNTLYFYRTGTAVNGSTTVPSNTWVHAAVTYDGTNLRMFQNGTVVYTQSGLTAASGTNNVTVGNYGASGDQPWFGSISNLRVVKGTALYTSNFTPSTTPLTAVSGTSLLTCQSNRFRDNSSNNFAITVTGTPSVQRFSPFDPAAEYSTSVIGGSGYFNGTSDYLTTSGGPTFSGDFTIEAWVYLTNLPTFSMLLGETNFPSYVGIKPTAIEVGFARSGNYPNWNFTFVRNTWYHLAISRQSGTVRCFLNGQQLTLSSGSATDTSTLSDGALAIGRYSYSPFYYFPGYISNLRIVNGTAVYTAAFTPPTSPVTAITGTSLLLNTVNAGIFDNAMMNDLVTVGNAQISTSVKKYGTGSMAFDGSGDYLTQPTDSNFGYGTGNFTIEFWLYLNATSDQTVVSNLTSATSVNPHIYYGSTGGIKYYTNNADRITGGSLSTSTWHHIAVCRSSGSTRLFVNGTQAGSTYTDTNNYGASAPLGVGTYWSAGAPVTTSTLNGYIDDLRITKGYARYTANFTPPTAAFPNN